MEAFYSADLFTLSSLYCYESFNRSSSVHLILFGTGFIQYSREPDFNKFDD